MPEPTLTNSGSSRKTHLAGYKQWLYEIYAIFKRNTLKRVGVLMYFTSSVFPEIERSYYLKPHL